MPSTFTSNTGIEKIADGEQTGLWGQTTNLNFDIVDRALNGSVDVALSGTTHTLTTSDGVLSDGQFAVLTFTGSPSGTNTVTIEPATAQKLYFVRNTTSQTVVLSQGSGANVSVPAGTSKIVFSNGAGASASVFDITNTLSGTFTGNVTGNASTATALQTARTIGGVSFNGTANIDLPGVNQAGNQNTSGNAGTATALQTARTIGGVSFNGTANINLPGVNQAGNQNTSGNAATATTATNLSRSVIAGTGLTGGGQLNANRTINADLASQAQAEAGTDNTRLMTPLRTKQAIEELAVPGVTEQDLIDLAEGAAGAPRLYLGALERLEAGNQIRSRRDGPLQATSNVILHSFDFIQYGTIRATFTKDSGGSTMRIDRVRNSGTTTLASTNSNITVTVDVDVLPGDTINFQVQHSNPTIFTNMRLSTAGQDLWPGSSARLEGNRAAT